MSVQSTSLVVTPHPLTLQGQRVYHGGSEYLPALLMPGERLSTFLARHDVHMYQQWVVSIGGVDVREVDWPRIKPRHGYLIEARRVAQRQVLAIVAIVALIYFTGGIGAAGAFGFAGGSIGAFAIQGLAYMAGSMVINKLLGPKPPSQQQATALSASRAANNASSPSYNLQGGKNRARQFEPMGLVLGEPYMIPDLGAQPYTMFVNGEQYLWQLFHCGINCASVNTLRIGQTPIENYVGVQVHREGFDSGNTGLPVLSSNVDSAGGGLLDGNAYVQRTSSTQTIVLAVDIETQLYAIDLTNGAFYNNDLLLTVEYRLVGSATWLVLAVSPPFEEVVPATFEVIVFLTIVVTPSYIRTVTPTTVFLRNASSKPLRATYQLTVTAGQYEVRLRKVSADQSSNGAYNQVQWSTLKSYQVDNGNYKGQSRFGMQAQATGQLNGSLDEVNCRGVAKPMPFWDGTAWTTATSRANGLSNPGALLLLLTRGIRDVDGKLIAGLGLPDDEIDIAGFQGFMTFCRLKGFNFDLFVQENTSIGDLLESIAAAGLGSRSEHTGKVGVIWFSDEQPIEGVLNMGTMKPKTFTVEYNVQATADEIEYQYFDRARNNTWKSVRVMAPGVTVPQRTARQALQGVTDEVQAAILARFSMAQNAFQRKTVSCDVDLEHVTFRRGTKMALSHDLTQWGYGGRLQACSNAAGILTLTLDDVIPSTSPTGAVTRYMGFRLAGEAQFRILPVAAFGGSTRTVTLAAAWPGGVAVPGDTADNPAHDTVWIYDFKATPGQRLRVSDIVPRGNLEGAQVQLVPDTPEFWDYVWNGAYTPPPNTSLLGQGLPVVLGAKVTEQLARQGNTFYTELTLTFDVKGNYDGAELWGAVAGGQAQLLASTRHQALSWRGGVAEIWSLEVRAHSATRLGVPFLLQYTVLGLSVPPSTPSGLALTQDSVYCQPTAQDVDVIGYVVRSTPGVVVATAASFLRATPCHVGYVTGFPWKFTTRLYGVQTVMVVAEDSTGNWSDVAYAALDFGRPSDNNIGQTMDYRAAGWPGVLTNCTVVSGDVVADVNPTSDLNNLADYNGEPDLNLTQRLAMMYQTTDFIPLYGGGTLVLDVATEGPDSTVEYRVSGSTTNNLNLLADWNLEADLNGVTGNWQPWPGALMVQRHMGMALRVSIGGGSQAPKLTQLLGKLALQRGTQIFEPLSIDAAGTRLAPSAGLPAVTWVRVQTASMLPQVDGSGAVGGRFLDLSSTLGPLVQQVNSSGVAVTSRATATVEGLIDL